MSRRARRRPSRSERSRGRAGRPRLDVLRRRPPRARARRPPRQPADRGTRVARGGRRPRVNGRRTRARRAGERRDRRHRRETAKDPPDRAPSSHPAPTLGRGRTSGARLGVTSNANPLLRHAESGPCEPLVEWPSPLTCRPRGRPELGADFWDCRFAGGDDHFDLLEIRAAASVQPTSEVPDAAAPEHYAREDTTHTQWFVAASTNSSERARPRSGMSAKPVEPCTTSNVHDASFALQSCRARNLSSCTGVSSHGSLVRRY